MKRTSLCFIVVGVLLLFATAGFWVGCGENVVSGQMSSKTPTVPGRIVFSPPNSSFAGSIGITSGPITADQAKRIAEVATGGTAISVEQEDQDGTQVFGVMVQTSDSVKDVKVRISDGAVTQIDDGTDEGGTEGGGD